MQVFRPKEISAPQRARRGEAWAAGRPRRSTSPVRMSNAPPAKLAIEVHTQDGPGRRRGDKMLLAPPVGGAARRLLLLPRTHGRHEDDMLDARLHGGVHGSDVLRPAVYGFRIDGRDDEQAIETRIGLRKALGQIVVPNPP